MRGSHGAPWLIRQFTGVRTYSSPLDDGWLAQWIARQPSELKVLGSSPRSVATHILATHPKTRPRIRNMSSLHTQSSFGQ